MLKKNKLAKVGSYAVGDVRALVPARKAVWSLPGEPKVPGKTFFLFSFLFCISNIIMPHLFEILLLQIYSQQISLLCLY